MLMSEQLFQTYSLFVLSWITRWVVTVVAFFSHNKIISEPFDFFWPFVVFFFLTLISSLMKDYFFKPPINKISLNFLKSPLEKAYRSSYKEEVHTSTQTHFSTQLFDDPTSDCDFDTLRWLTWGLTKNSTQQKRGLPTWIRKKNHPKTWTVKKQKAIRRWMTNSSVLMHLLNLRQSVWFSLCHCVLVSLTDGVELL